MTRFFLVCGVIALGAVSAAGPTVIPDVPSQALARVSVATDEAIYATVRDRAWTIVVARRGAIEPPSVLVAPPAGYVAMSPALAPDGRLYFESNLRAKGPDNRDDTDVWVVERAGGAWGTPRPLGSPFDSPYNEHFPTLDRAGTLCFNSKRPETRDNDILCGPVDGSAPPRLIDAVNSESADASPWLSPSGDVLVFTSNRAGGIGGWDLYVSRRTAAGWGQPRNPGAPLNSPRDEFGVSLSEDGDRLVYLRYGNGGPREVLTAPLPR